MLRSARGGFRPAAFLAAALALLVLPGLPQSSSPAGASPPAQAGGPPQQVDGPTISTLIRTTIVALHQANVTGNYTVLRDLGASELHIANTAADLSAQFADFRQKRINLASTVLFDPVLDQKPQLSPDGMLRLVGHFPTRPQEAVFDLTFLFEAGAWRIAQIKVATRLPQSAATGTAASDTNAPAPRPRPAKP